MWNHLKLIYRYFDQYISYRYYICHVPKFSIYRYDSKSPYRQYRYEILGIAPELISHGMTRQTIASRLPCSSLPYTVSTGICYWYYHVCLMLYTTYVIVWWIGIYSQYQYYTLAWHTLMNSRPICTCTYVQPSHTPSFTKFIVVYTRVTL